MATVWPLPALADVAARPYALCRSAGWYAPGVTRPGRTLVGRALPCTALRMRAKHDTRAGSACAPQARRTPAGGFQAVKGAVGGAIPGWRAARTARAAGPRGPARPALEWAGSAPATASDATA